MTMTFVCAFDWLRARSEGHQGSLLEEWRWPAEAAVTPSASRHPARDVNRNLLDVKKGR